MRISNTGSGGCNRAWANTSRFPHTGRGISVLKDGMDVRVTNSYDVSVTADGTTNSFTMGEGTVRDALNRIGVTLGDDDEVSPELDS